MHPEIGATELLVIAAVALIVVGPKDLPILLRKLGQFMGKLRAMANEFRASFDEMARQSELDELRREVEAMRRGQFADMAALDASHAEVTETFQEIDHSLSGVRFPPSPLAAEPVAEAEPAPVTIAEAPKAAPKPRAKPKPKAAKAEAPAAAAPKRKAAPKAEAASAAPTKPKAPPRTRKTKTGTGA